VNQKLGSWEVEKLSNSNDKDKAVAQLPSFSTSQLPH